MTSSFGIVSNGIQKSKRSSVNHVALAMTKQRLPVETTTGDASAEVSSPIRFATSTAAVLMMAALVFVTPNAALADEYGRESEALFLDTGETVMICTKRGPLGACQKTERRTVGNENDKSEKYFRQPTVVIKGSGNADSSDPSAEGNLLIERLRKQSEENAEKNELLVYQRTLLNDSSASFGPFDGQVLILNEDGKGFSLLENPQAMRLKKAGFIENKKFVKQPTPEELDAALNPEKPGGIFAKLFGGGDDE